MAGIYIHIPFCKSRCIYCDYFTSINEVEMDQYVHALCKEIKLRKTELSHNKIKTIYFGGGTPSRLHRFHFEKIFETIHSNYKIDSQAEITIEANPDDLSQGYIDMLRELPLNRISIGVQSFDDHELQFLSRRHNSQTAIDSVKYCQEKGFDNISIDLMYGLPNQTLEIWQSNLDKARQLNIQHISAYHLIYEDKTRLYSLLKSGGVKPVDEDCSLEMFEMLISTLKKDGFIHYEVSNFAKDGFVSQHNSSYWKGVKYIGLGPSAHSFDGEHRWWNVSSIPKYIKGISNGKPDLEKEDIDLAKKYNEFLITGLRTMWGIDVDVLKTKFENDKYEYFFKYAEKYFNLNYLVIDKTKVTLSHKGIFIVDGIVSDLMIV